MNNNSETTVILKPVAHDLVRVVPNKHTDLSCIRSLRADELTWLGKSQQGKVRRKLRMRNYMCSDADEELYRCKLRYIQKMRRFYFGGVPADDLHSFWFIMLGEPRPDPMRWTWLREEIQRH